MVVVPSAAVTDEAGGVGLALVAGAGEAGGAEDVGAVGEVTGASAGLSLVVPLVLAGASGAGVAGVVAAGA